MKRFISITAAVICVLSIFFAVAISSSADSSPVATTYPTTQAQGHNSITRADSGNAAGFTAVRVTRTPRSNGGYQDSSRSIRPINSNGYKSDADDPNSPNYTGNANATKDGSKDSPDTSAQSPAPAAIAVAIVLCGVCAGVVSTRKKNGKES
ncbi:MAG: hypothetical protein K6B52_01160 [Clostridiales bacterium]|nr:hypothetical protein [Clostridiales bacterium]